MEKSDYESEIELAPLPPHNSNPNMSSRRQPSNDGQVAGPSQPRSLSSAHDGHEAGLARPHSWPVVNGVQEPQILTETMMLTTMLRIMAVLDRIEQRFDNVDSRLDAVSRGTNWKKSCLRNIPDFIKKLYKKI